MLSALMLLRSELFGLIVSRIDAVNDESDIILNYGGVVDLLEELSGILIVD